MTLSQNIYTVKTFEFLIIFNYGQIFLKASSAIYDIFKSLKSFPGNISVFGVFWVLKYVIDFFFFCAEVRYAILSRYVARFS